MTHLPSHMLPCQTAAFLGVSRQTISERIAKGSLPVVEILGTRMVPTMAILKPDKLISKDPQEVISLVDKSLKAIESKTGDTPLFSAQDLAELFLALTRSGYETRISA